MSAAGTLPLVIAGAFVMGLGYGATNPAASLLLARVPSKRMNLIFSLKQSGVPIGGVLSGLIVPPITQWAGWHAALATCAVLIGLLGLGIGVVRAEWDAGRTPGAPVLASVMQSVEVVWKSPILRWLAAASFLYSGVQMSLTGFLLTYLVTDVAIGLVMAGTILSVTHASGAFGRVTWGFLADRFRSGGGVLVANGVMTICGALLVAAIDPRWPMVFVIAACAFFGFSALGWNGVYIAAIARRAPAGTIGLATGGSLFVTYAGVIVTPPAFAAFHDRLDLTYGTSFALLSAVSAIGIACVAMAWRARMRADAPAPG